MSGEQQLSRLLRGLAQDEPITHGSEIEEERARRISEGLDRQLAALVRRRHARWRTAALAAAAALALGFGAWRSTRRPLPLWIQSEPVTALRPPASTQPNPPSFPAQEPTLPRSVALPVTRPPTASRPAQSAVPPAPSGLPVGSTLREENQLFEQAATASRNGDDNAALGHLDRLLAEHPDSPLAQGALVKKFRLLAKAGREADATAAAKRYLQLYPTGFAVNEAAALVGEAAP